MSARQIGRMLSPAVLLFAGRTVAQGNDPEAVARALFERADEEMTAADFTHACPHFEDVKRLIPDHINTGIKLAECYVGQGRLASALTELRRVKVVAETKQKADKVTLIDEQLADLSPRVPKLKVDVPADVASIAGLRIRRNGVELVPGHWGIALPVDPGTYSLEVTAPRRKAWETKFDVLPKAAPSVPPVVVTVEAPAVEPAVSDGHAPGAKPRAETTPPVVIPGRSGMRTAGYVGVGLGVLGLGVGGVLGGLAISRNGESNDGHCSATDHCSRVGYDLRKDAQAFGNASTVVTVIGAAALATGVVLVVVSSGAPKGKEKTSVVVGPGGVALRGGF